MKNHLKTSLWALALYLWHLLCVVIGTVTKTVVVALTVGVLVYFALGCTVDWRQGQISYRPNDLYMYTKVKHTIDDFKVIDLGDCKIAIVISDTGSVDMEVLP